MSLSKTIVFRNVPFSICLSIIKKVVVEIKENGIALTPLTFKIFEVCGFSPVVVETRTRGALAVSLWSRSVLLRKTSYLLPS